jgi:hypothetical protein
MNLPDAPIALEGFFATHFFTVSDQDRSKDFYVRILGGKVIKPDNPCYIKLANTWIILNSGGGPTPDKPEVLLETPSNLNPSSTTAVNLAAVNSANDKQEDVPSFLGSAHEAIRSLVRRAIKSGDTQVFSTGTSPLGMELLSFLLFPRTHLADLVAG